LLSVDPKEISSQDLQHQREVTRRELARANRAGLAIVFVVLMLAFAAILAAWQADREAVHADDQRAHAEERLWQSLLAQARAARLSGQAGRRSEALNALEQAARIRPSRELRDEAIASLAVMDLGRETYFFPMPTNAAMANFSPGLDLVAMAMNDGAVRIVRAQDEQLLHQFNGSGEAPLLLRWSPDGAWIGVRHASRTRVWHRPTGRLVVETGPNPSHTGVDGPLAFSPDSRRVAIGVRDQVEIYDLADGTLWQRISPTPKLASFAFHPQRPWLAFCYLTNLVIWDFEANKLVKTFSVDPSQRTINSAAWSPNGRFLAAGCEGQSIFVWDTLLEHTRNGMEFTGHERAVIHVAFDPTSNLLLSHAWGGVTRIWGLKGNLWVASNRGYGFQFSPDGRQVSFSRPDGVGLWLLESGAPAYTPLSGRLRPHQDRVDFSPDGRWLAATDGQFGGVWLWDLATREIVSSHLVAPPQWVQFTSDGAAVLTAGRDGFHRWPLRLETNSSGVAGNLGPGVHVHPGTIEQPPTLTRDGGRVLFLVENHRGGNEPLLLNLENVDPLTAWKDRTNLYSIALSPRGDRVAASGLKGGLRVWKTDSNESLHDTPSPPSRVWFGPDDRWLAVATPIGYEFRDAHSYALSRSFTRENPSEQAGWLDFTSDGEMAAIVKSHARVELIDAKNLESLTTLELPDGREASRVRFSRDGRYLAMFARDGFIHLWHLPALREKLARLGLDWGGTLDSRLRTLDTASGQSPKSKSVRFYGLLALALAGVVLGTAFALFAVRRHRDLMDRYFRIDDLAARRSEQLAQVQAELFHSQKMRALGTLAAGIAHDFNNLLSVIRMANKLTGEETRANADIQENVQLVEKTVAQGKSVVRSMLGYSRESGERSRYAVAGVVEETVKMLHTEFLGGITLDISLAPGTPEVEGARNRLEQILLNLIMNAAEAMGGRGKLRIAVNTTTEPKETSWVLRPRGGREFVQVIIADTGPGMTPEVRERIFEPFFTTKTIGNVRGTGLGLSMVYTIAQEEGFGLTLESEPGQGTTFRILVPAAY
jgi:signal transduction histidine kinase